ncbi:ATP-binding protein [Janthinobacterium psychrotolerans]|uniref:histidine kinase n=1 Tax=Janthinobacterium psychrotolerans TaxID=1747903 RepID=A0A1A7C1M1_9BURK|nr:ATP-binding protein [Janthinobacterium psychrotolerans]OBV38904.1 Signal transduction histidine kinase [Janthinobacterium psychrotolerans]
MSQRILTAVIGNELDVVGARQRARQIAALCGFGVQDQVRIATAVSELARNVYNYAGSGKIHFAIDGSTAPQVFSIRIEDRGPGIAQLDRILAGQYQSQTGMGLGILGARRLMDRFEIHSVPGKGTEITLQKLFPREAPLLTGPRIGALSGSLQALPSDITLAEVQQQNHELLATLAELKTRQDELLQLTRELEDTNRGVVALYAELDEKADHLRRADQMKSRFLSNMSHEFRTPLSSIRALSKLLIDRVDGELSVEQEKQVMFILQSAVGLNDLVNDLLDLAKIEAGKVDVHASTFNVADLFSALRGMLRPLLVSESLSLTFIDPDPALEMHSDEGKLSQILRNFISNALKFTEAGAIVVSATPLPAQGAIRFAVADTGLGISAEDQQLIFEEFSQVENHLQRRVKGTGLGLPLCRNLATLLGGKVAVESTPGTGSVFSVTLPVRHDARASDDPIPAPSGQAGSDDRIAVLVVEDNASIRLLYQKFLADTEFRPVFARSVHEAVELWEQERPAAVLLDILLHGENSWHWLAELKNDPLRRHVPVIIATEVEDQRKGLALGADAYYIKPLLRPQLLAGLRGLIPQDGRTTIQESQQALSRRMATQPGN